MTPRIAFLGPEGSYSHQAALRQFGRRVEYCPAPGILAAIEMAQVRKRRVWAVVPFENVSSGVLEETVWALMDDPFRLAGLRVCGEIAMRIDLALLGRGPVARVRTVYSHRVPLMRCRAWLAERFPGVWVAETDSTAAAARRAVREDGAAAIASSDLAAQLGLKILVAPAGPRGVNVTQFLIVGRDPLPRVRPSHTMLWFTLPHRPRALGRALVILGRDGLNLTRVASHALPDNFREYAFLVELVGRAGTPRVDRALGRLGRFADTVQVLGSYPVWTRV